MNIKLKDYLSLKRDNLFSELEKTFLCANEATDFDSFTISRDVLKGLYTLALANLNRDSSCLNTVYAVEKIVGNDPSFKMIRRTLGSPKKRYFGMHNLKNW